MKTDAEAHADEDQKEKDRIEAKNKGENLVYVAEKSVKDAGDKLPQDVKDEVESKVKELKGF